MYANLLLYQYVKFKKSTYSINLPSLANHWVNKKDLNVVRFPPPSLCSRVTFTGRSAGGGLQSQSGGHTPLALCCPPPPPTTLK